MRQHMRIGIDFGTTRTVVAAADRGNYPVLSFQTDSEDSRQWYPSLIAARAGECVFGFEAAARQGESGWIFLRSLKRLLSEANPQTAVQLGRDSLPVISLLVGYLKSLKDALYRRSNLDVRTDEPLEALIAVPANSNSNQRFLTLEAFALAGFKVIGMINEPSAAGIEYAHRYRPSTASAKYEHLVVYDLGGGTFDTSIVGMKDRSHEVLTNEGISRLGGDDFDEILLRHTLAEARIDSLDEMAHFQLLEECREQKERLNPNTRKIVIDLGRAVEGGGEIVIPVAEYYECCQPLVERTIAAVESAIAQVGSDPEPAWKSVAAIYLVGGSSDLPVVSRTLRERYGRRIRRSPYPFAATAIGLAIAADAEAGYELKETFTRHFGVWRETENGKRISFDPMFRKDTPLPRPGETPLVYRRIYHPAHNIGHFRYLECSRLTQDGQPAGDITPWDEILFPFDPALQGLKKLNDIEVRRSETLGQQVIQEEYSCDSTGVIRVTIGECATGFTRKFRLRE